MILNPVDRAGFGMICGATDSWWIFRSRMIELNILIDLSTCRDESVESHNTLPSKNSLHYKKNSYIVDRQVIAKKFPKSKIICV